MTYDRFNGHTPLKAEADTKVGFQLLARHLVEGPCRPDFVVESETSEHWHDLACWIASLSDLPEHHGSIFLVDLTACLTGPKVGPECGPNAGGYVCIGDTEIIVNLLFYASPQATGDRALAMYQVQLV